MDFSTFAAEIRARRAPKPVYVFAGLEAFLRERGVQLLKEYFPDAGRNTLRVSSSETDWSRLADELYTPSLTGGRKLVVLADEGNFVNNEAEALRQYHRNPSPSAILAVLVPSEKIPPLEGVPVVDCRPLRPGDLRRWLASEAQRMGKHLDSAASGLLVSRGGSALSALMGHLEKLVLYVGARGEITEADVRALVGNQEEREVYELALAVTSKETARAFRILRRLLATGESVSYILWRLAWQYRRLAEARKLLEAGRRRPEVASRLGITYYQEEFLKQADRHTVAELVEKHGEILKADVALKTSGGGEIPILESLIFKLAAGGS